MRFGLGQKIKIVLWTAGALLFGILAAFFLNNIPFEQGLPTDNLAYVASTAEAEEKNPEFFYFLKNQKETPKVTAAAYVVGDLETGEIILAKNEAGKYPIASVSKLMTALVTEEGDKKDGIAQISKKVLATEGENGDLRINEKIKAGDLLYPLLMESSNDAAEALAEYEGRDVFIKKMNLRADELNLLSTSFEDPSGLSPNNQSSALDLFKLTKYIKDTSEEIFKITTTRSYKNEKHVWFNNNQFLKEIGYTGGKSGFTDEARQTGISTFSVNLGGDTDRKIAITVLRTPDRHKDVNTLLKYLKKNVYYGQEPEIKEVVLQPPPVPEIKEPDFVTLLFAGDIMLDRGVESSVVKNFGGDYSALFEKVDQLKSADIAFANLEGPASDKGEDLHNLYSFRMDPSVIPALRGAGIDVLSLANNHIGDWGHPALVDTMTRLKENEILYTGADWNAALAEEPEIIEKYGMKIGYLGFSDKGPTWMRAKVDTAGVLLASNPRFDEIVKNASEKVDYLIVSFHFGEEYETIHDARQEELAHRAVDAGAKIVIGHHPHVTQDTEVYKNSLIAYSLGNFIFDQVFSTATMEGTLLEVKLHKDGSMTATKNVAKLNRVFQVEKVVKGKEEKVIFEVPEKIITQ